MSTDQTGAEQCSLFGSAPELFAVPVDRWMSFHFHVTVNFGLAGQPNFFFRVAEQLQAQERVDPLVDAFQNAFATAVLRTLLHGHVATAAGSETHAVQDLVRAGIQLHAILHRNGPNVFAVLCLNGDLFVHKVNRWHEMKIVNRGLSDAWSAVGRKTDQSVRKDRSSGCGC